MAWRMSLPLFTNTVVNYCIYQTSGKLALITQLAVYTRIVYLRPVVLASLRHQNLRDSHSCLYALRLNHRNKEYNILKNIMNIFEGD